MNNKILSTLGLCKRAGRLVSGEFSCENAIREGKAKLILVADNASKNTIKKFTNSAHYYQVEIIISGTKEEIGAALGVENRAVVVIVDDGFQKKVKELFLLEEREPYFNPQLENKKDEK